jgi:hypothetical protein
LGVIGGAAVLTLVVPAGAGAETVQPYGGGNTVVTDPGSADSGVGSASAGAESDGSLPFTGGDVAGLVAIGAGTVVAGAIATRLRRHRQAV